MVLNQMKNNRGSRNRLDGYQDVLRNTNIYGMDEDNGEETTKDMERLR